MSGFEEEEVLTGGNVSNVYRSGNTVRRELKSGSHKIHRILKHLENKGFSYAPKFLGIDEKRREVLSFIEGEAGNYPLKQYMWSDDVLIEIGKMLRLYHDSVSDFSFDDSWKSIDNTPKPFEILCHNDFAIYNIVFNDERPIGIIDFDVAAPGPRLWDIAYTLYTCVPLSRFYLSETGEKIHYNSSQHAQDRKRRVKLFFESYGEELQEGYLEMVLLRLEGLCKTITRKASEGDIAFQKMIDEGHLEHYQNDIKFIYEHTKEWI
ncbi:MULTISPECIES: phosphotransferase [Priestia]|uniref:Phosphotransferase n=1 Tax=Priestia megaterium TaxID=1404 RepID=A0AAX6BHE8_PRIMG|nr:MULTISPECIES: phosphotransferase [Priestia]MBY0212837.1 phosphotransferase [Priestia aryabhattai]MCA1049156.1 phosphotransferase [Priestia aryabhattai]MED3820450.1 phosphotransferase [Priestia aryabhattai]PHF72823.1 aminoglycoside phosphotransferase [Priestia aryabhattai]QFY72526.1 aminoglycoside phosphotransferase [Priestia megaterium]